MQRFLSACAKFIESLAQGFYLLVGILVLGIVLIYKSVCDVASKMTQAQNLIRTYILPNVALLLIGLVLTFAAMYLLHRYKDRIKIPESNKLIFIATGIFLVVKIWVSWEILFKTEWDAGWMFSVAKCLNNGEEQTTPYLSMFPFNLITVEYLRLCIKIGTFFNPNGIEPGLITVMVLNCVQVAITALLVFDLVKHVLNSTRMAWITWICYIVFIGTSPWVCIPYTDSMTFMIPTLVLWLYMKLQEKKCTVGIWTMIALFAYWGYRIKGVALLVFLSILLTQLLHMMREHSIDVKRTLLSVASMALVILVSSKVLIPGLIKHTTVPYNPNHNLGLEYLLCVGLNPWTHGTFTGTDFDMAYAHPDKEERHEEIMRLIHERLDDYGASGLLEHQMVKTVIIYDDGTFAWSQEGGFYKELFPEHDWFSPRLRNIFYEMGDHFGAYISMAQLIWLTVFLLSLGLVFYKPQEKYHDVVLALTMSIAAMFVFVELTEARARYLYTFSPLYLIAGVIGSYVLYQRIFSKKTTD